MRYDPDHPHAAAPTPPPKKKTSAKRKVSTAAAPPEPPPAARAEARVPVATAPQVNLADLDLDALFPKPSAPAVTPAPAAPRPPAANPPPPPRREPVPAKLPPHQIIAQRHALPTHLNLPAILASRRRLALV